MTNAKQNQPNDDATLRALLDTAVDGIITIDERGIVEAANPAAERLFGYASAEMVGHNISMLMPSPYREEHDGYLANYARSGERRIIGIGREVEGKRKDGATFPLYLSVSEVSFGDRRSFTGFLHDLTDLRRAEERATQLGRILEDSLNEIFVFDMESLRFVFVNRGALANIGYSEDELFQLTPLDIKPEYSRSEFDELLRPLVSGETGLLQFETVHQRKDSSTYHVSIRLQLAIWRGRPAFVAIILDISEQVMALQELALRDQQFQFMIDHLPGAAAYVDHQSQTLRFNPMIQDITGYEPDSFRTLDDFFTRLTGDTAAREQYESYRLGWDDGPLRFTVHHKDGLDRIVEFRGYGYDNHEVWLIQDVTTRDRQEIELRIRNQAIKSANESIVISDASLPTHPIIFVNDAFEKLSGYTRDEAIGQGCTLLCGDQTDQVGMDALQAAMDQCEDHRTTLRCQRKNGDGFWNEISVAPVRSPDGEVTHLVALMEDVSDRRNAQQQLLQSERLAAIGQMVTGLAHESRNALQRAQACLDMLSLDLEDQPEQLELTEKTRRALTDLHRYYEEVRNYAAPINLECHPQDLKSIWHRTWQTLEGVWFGRAFEVIEVTDTAELVCNVDEHRIEQVFRNIMENALAACPDPGELTVTWSSATSTGVDGVRVSVRDNGPGLDSNAASSIFQPFFTTKQKGTGLGMAISKRIVSEHGGRIEVGPSAPGAEIIVELPYDKTSQRPPDS